MDSGVFAQVSTHDNSAFSSWSTKEAYTLEQTPERRLLRGKGIGHLEGHKVHTQQEVADYWKPKNAVQSGDWRPQLPRVLEDPKIETPTHPEPLASGACFNFCFFWFDHGSFSTYPRLTSNWESSSLRL